MAKYRLAQQAKLAPCAVDGIAYATRREPPNNTQTAPPRGSEALLAMKGEAHEIAALANSADEGGVDPPPRPSPTG